MSHALLIRITVIQVQAIVDHHHNVDAKVPTKVRFQEPGNQSTNVTDDTKEKLMHDSESNNKEDASAEEANEEKEEAKEDKEEEAKLISGSPKAENKENEEKEVNENNVQENKSQSPEVKKPTITP